MEVLFNSLKSIFGAYAPTLDVVHDEPGYFYLNTKKNDDKGKPIFFGKIKATSKKVTYHLMPIYCEPSLLENISSGLKKRMQGKSCFNFTKIEPQILRELEALTNAGFESYMSNGKI